MAKFRAAETWDAYACNSGTRTAQIRDLLRCEGRETLDGTDSIELDVPRTDPGAAVATREVIRLAFRDESFTEWRVRSKREQNTENGIVVTITAVTPLQDMADAGAISELSLAGVPQFEIGLSKVSIEEVLDTYILPHLAAAGYGYFAKGLIEPTELFDVVLFKMTPLAALRYLCDLARDEVTKRPAELRIRRNGTTNYLIDVVRRIGEFLDDGETPQPVADLRYRKNLRRTDLTTDSERQANVVQPFGATLPDGTPSGIGRVAFRFIQFIDDVYVVTDPEGGPCPIQFDDQLTGYFLVPDAWPTNPLVEILTTAAPLGGGGGGGTVQLASATGITSGKVYELRDADGNLLSEMPSSTSVTDRKVQAIERGDIVGVRNIVGNGWLRNWPDSSLPPSDCTFYPDTGSAAPYTSQNTDPLYTQLGGKSLRITDEDSTAGRIVGLRYPVFYPAAVEGRALHAIKVRVFFKRFAGAAWFYITPRDGLTGDVVVDSEGRQIKLQLVASDNTIEGGYVPTIGSWVDVSIINVDLLAYNLPGVILDVTAGAGYGGSVAGSVDCFIDAVQVTQTVGEAPDGFVEYSGSNALWREGNRVLATFTAPPEHYELEVDDLTRFDGTAYPFDALVLGATVRLTDKSLAITGEELRLVEKTVDYLQPRRTQIKVASRWEQFVDLGFAAGARPGVQATPQLTPQQPPPGSPPVPPTGTGAGPSIVTLPISDGNTMRELIALGEEPVDAWPRQRPWFDATGCTHMRVIADVDQAGAFGSEVFAERTTNPDDEGSYVEPGVSGAPVTVVIDGAGPKRGAWTTIAATGDNVWRARPRDGDGVASPRLGKVHFQFLRGAGGNGPPDGAPPDDGLPDPLWWSKSGDLMFADDDEETPNDGSDGSNVAVWGDKTGNGWKYTRGLTGNPPVLRTTETDPRGLAAVEFKLHDGILQYFRQNSGSVAGRDQVTCFIVKRHPLNVPSVFSQTGIWHYGRRIGSNDAAHPSVSSIVWESFGQGWHQRLNITPWPFDTRPFDAWHVWCVRSDALRGTTGLMDCFYNGVLCGQRGIVGAFDPHRWPVETRGDPEGADAYLGHSYSHQGEFWCTEIIAYAAALTDEQILAKSAALLL